MTKTLDLPERAELAPPADLNPRQLCALAVQSGAGMDVLERLTSLAERWDAAEAKKKYTEAISGFQSECPTIFKKRVVKTRDGQPMYAFASYDDIKKVTRPLETKWGITVEFSFDLQDDPKAPAGKLCGTCKVRVGSHHEDKTLTIPVPKGVNTNLAQDGGQAVTYLKRYLYCAALDIVVTDEDNDADIDARLTDEQVQTVEKLIHDSRSSLSRFLDWAKVTTVRDIKANDYSRVIDMLNRKMANARGAK